MAGTRLVSSTVSTDSLRSWGSDCRGLLQKGRPMLPLWAVPGWASRTKTWQPGNHPQSPTPGQAPGQVPGNPGSRQDHLDFVFLWGHVNRCLSVMTERISCGYKQWKWVFSQGRMPSRERFSHVVLAEAPRADQGYWWMDGWMDGIYQGVRAISYKLWREIMKYWVANVFSVLSFKIIDQHTSSFLLKHIRLLS